MNEERKVKLFNTEEGRARRVGYLKQLSLEQMLIYLTIKNGSHNFKN